MTEAGRKWALELDGPHPDTVERIVRAFCEDVVRLSEDPKYIHEPGRRGLAFDELKRKFLED